MPSRSVRPAEQNYIEEDQIRRALENMELDEAFVTESSYSANVVIYPDHRISFGDKHMAYLKKNPQLNPEQYLSNLRLMTKVRT
jgi:hypothetical protein